MRDSSFVSIEGEKEMPKFRFGFLFSFDINRTSTGDGCLFLLEPRASESKEHQKQNKKPSDVRMLVDDGLSLPPRVKAKR